MPTYLVQDFIIENISKNPNEYEVIKLLSKGFGITLNKHNNTFIIRDAGIKKKEYDAGFIKEDIVKILLDRDFICEISKREYFVTYKATSKLIDMNITGILNENEEENS